MLLPDPSLTVWKRGGKRGGKGGGEEAASEKKRREGEIQIGRIILDIHGAIMVWNSFPPPSSPPPSILESSLLLCHTLMQKRRRGGGIFPRLPPRMKGKRKRGRDRADREKGGRES